MQPAMTPPLLVVAVVVALAASAVFDDVPTVVAIELAPPELPDVAATPDVPPPLVVALVLALA